ncbi:MAG: signal peptide peptidase SppA [Desulfovibrionaceae bacterium]|nr:signal peptide peptidase SppA [Desulfovibrionaceae bacterium]
MDIPSSARDTASGGAPAADAAAPLGRREYDRSSHWQVPKPLKKPFRKRRPALFWLGACIVLGGVLAALGNWLAEDEDNILGREYLAVVRVEGFIGDTRKLLAWVDRLTRDKSIKGVLLRVNSPGGGAAASHELYDALKRLAAKKPVYASMGSVAASGGLMVALAAERVLATPTTFTGSIGVKMEIPQVHGLMEKLGLHRESIASGRYKDAGTPFRPMTEDERTYLTEVINDMHTSFVTLVVQARQLSEEKVRDMADGRILTGAKALELGLVDALGGQAEALRQLRAAAHVEDRTPLLEQPKEGKRLRELLESVLGITLDTRVALPEFLYLY